MEDKKRLPFGVKLGYCVGGISESVPYYLFYIYYLIFLTDVVGVKPWLAGTISFVAILVDAVSAPIIGNLSDRSRGRFGRRRSFMLFSVAPLAACVYLLFMPVPFVGVAQAVYYIAVCAMLWLSFSLWVIPFLALGSDMTQDLSGRNTLRTYTMVIEFIFLIVSTAGPQALIMITAAADGSQVAAWHWVGAIAAALVAASCVVCLLATRGRDKVQGRYEQHAARVDEASGFAQDGAPDASFSIDSNTHSAPDVSDANSGEGIITVLRQLFRIKSYRNLCAMILVYISSSTMVVTTIAYVLTSLAHLAPEDQLLFFIYFSLISIAALPLTNMFCNKYGKKETLIVLMVLSIVSLLLFFFIGLSSLPLVLAYAVLPGAMDGTFSAMHIAITYDMSDLDEFLNGKRREGAIVAISCFAQKVGAAIGVFLTGLILDLFGYGGEAATADTLAQMGILLNMTLIPASLLLVAVLLFSRYRLTKRKYLLLAKALEKKRAGLEYETDGFEDLL
jgi:GPH family glycoside/pentoside/hexuronide:cation symporter